ncbi:MAG: bifunctional 23S rRNA (guanine(2069)-N(7))-methyltransferase RlmK/23S rRNA (guanine(2445)-N(2))-methyltransferase RlmL [Magnetococcales bacterium]|nr:bifunctional 23S rRNA (guanine(2069)-N(7))-methyltransferase RlmK/23S rRNA (guanine(2445)-N(2))-methyltransferase RlmL [Magnetococcales bacterium]
MTHHELFATSPQGTESLLARELGALGAERIRPVQGGVSFTGTLRTACMVCLWSRVASRLLLPLARFRIASAEDLHAGVMDIPWEDHLRLNDTFAVDFFGTGDGIRHTHFGGLRVKDGLADRFRLRNGRRPSVRLEAPDIRIHCRLRDHRVLVALDLSGESLHRRGYRMQAGAAPLKENLAAAILLLSDWPAIASQGGAFLDPLCGTGALVIEAALMAADAAPGLWRDYYGFKGWLGMDAKLWDQCVAEARERFAVGITTLPDMLGLDAAPGAIKGAEANAAKAGLTGRIRFECQPLEHLSREMALGASGLLVTNPPYGVRLGAEEEVLALHERLGELSRRHFSQWHCAIFSGVASPEQALGREPDRREALKNGSLPCQLLHYSPQAPAIHGAADKPIEIDAFVNRLSKNKKRLAGWCHREGIGCYRVYDADIPEFALGIDLYENRVHVQEYAPPKSVDAAKARERLRLAMAAIPDVLRVPADHVHLKTRQRGPGGARYGVLERLGRYHEVGEGGLRFLINLTDRLDTGLFLDYRLMRSKVREHARGRRFLNLFGYTGTATVYAAAGGAAATVTVDMSHAYLDWARKNCELNGVSGHQHRFVHADCLAWLDNTRERFDLILLDPPSFSNSKGMARPLNLQRDHGELILKAAGHLSSGGILLFSTNFQRFKLDEAALQSRLLIREITRETIPRDFSRNDTIHRAWMLTHKEKNQGMKV